MNKRLTDKRNTWCPGCGNFGILNAVQKAIDLLVESSVSEDKLVMTSGIGCHGKIFDYLKLSGFYSLHGRAMSTAQGIKIGNPDLNVIMFGGDGDSLGEGLEHTLFAAKRNEDITLILHNNGVYGLTTGQFSPLSEKGYKGPSSPFGNIEQPFDPLPLILSAGAGFVARSYTTKPEHLALLIKEAVLHKGFSFIEVLQPCVSFNNTYTVYNKLVKELDGSDYTFEDAYRLVSSKDPIYIGRFFKEEKPVFSDTIIPENYRDSDVNKIELRKKKVQDFLAK